MTRRGQLGRDEIRSPDITERIDDRNERFHDSSLHDKSGDSEIINALELSKRGSNSQNSSTSTIGDPLSMSTNSTTDSILLNSGDYIDGDGLDKDRSCPKSKSGESISISNDITMDLISMNSPRRNGEQEPASLEFGTENPNGIETETEATFTWRIPSWNALKRHDRVYSDEFVVGNCRWKVLLCPRGNSPRSFDEYSGRSVFNDYDDEEGSISLFVGLADPDDLTRKDRDWSVCAKILLALINPADTTVRVVKTAQHRFDANESDWGFAQFLPTSVVRSSLLARLPNQPLVSEAIGEEGKNERCLDHCELIVFARVRVVKDPNGVLWHSFINYNSKKVTGFVGLQNQGATCYMNSLLQSLYMTNLFRKAAFMIPTENDNPNDSIPLGLQRVFYRLQTSNHPVGTTELTRSFGWDSIDSFMQHDVQEFSRVLLDELETKMKGSKAEGMIADLFRGKIKNVIKCLNVPYESVRQEDFYDIQLTIRGVRNLKDSFDRYVQEERMVGDNRYRAEGYGLQDACRFVVFDKLPPVLHLHLERYTFDPATGAIVKINDRFEFPLEINLDRYVEAGSPPNMDYVLHSVLVHSGDSHGGHYCVFIRDGLIEEYGEREEEDKVVELSKPKKDRWLKFDDTKVIPVSEQEAVQDNYGGSSNGGGVGGGNGGCGEGESEDLITGGGIRGDGDRVFSRENLRERRFKRFTNAYMLVYVRKSDLGSVLGPVSLTKDIPAHLVKKVQAEQLAESQRKVERQQAMTNLVFYLYDEEMVSGYQGFDLFDDYHQSCLEDQGLKAVSTDEGIGGVGVGGRQNVDRRGMSKLPFHVEPKKIVMKREQTVGDLFDQITLLYKSELTKHQSFRLWSCALRRNKTVRLDEPLIDRQAKLGILFGKVVQLANPIIFKENIVESVQSTALPMGMSVDPNDNMEQVLSNASKDVMNKDSAMISFKYFDREEQTLRPMAHLIVDTTKPIAHYQQKLVEMVVKGKGDRSQDKSITTAFTMTLAFWEEVKPGRIDPIDATKTFKQMQLQTGDILCFQFEDGKISSDASRMMTTGLSTGIFNSPVEYLNDLLYWIKLSIKKKGKNCIKIVTSAFTHQSPTRANLQFTEPTTMVYVSLQLEYQQVLRQVAKGLGFAPNKEIGLRLWIKGMNNGITLVNYDADGTEKKMRGKVLVPISNWKEISFEEAIRRTSKAGANELENSDWENVERRDLELDEEEEEDEGDEEAFEFYWEIMDEQESLDNLDAVKKLFMLNYKTKEGYIDCNGNDAAQTTQAVRDISLEEIYVRHGTSIAELISSKTGCTDNTSVLVRIYNGRIIKIFQSEELVDNIEDWSILMISTLEKGQQEGLSGKDEEEELGVLIGIYGQDGLQNVFWQSEEGDEQEVWRGLPNCIVAKPSDTLEMLTERIIQKCRIPSDMAQVLRRHGQEIVNIVPMTTSSTLAISSPEWTVKQLFGGENVGGTSRYQLAIDIGVLGAWSRDRGYLDEMEEDNLQSRQQIDAWQGDVGRARDLDAGQWPPAKRSGTTPQSPGGRTGSDKSISISQPSNTRSSSIRIKHNK